MVSNNVIISMIIVMVICVLFPIGIFIYFKIKEGISIKTTLGGIIGFVLFALILEQILHKIVMSSNIIPVNTLAFGIYGALAAGVFEETGRFLVFKTFIKNKREWKDGLGYAIGHGGIEAILLGGLSFLNSLIITFALNSGTLDTMLKGQSESMVEGIKASVMNATPLMIGVGGIERIFAFMVQVGLTFVVFYGIKKRKNIYLLYAILLHALVDIVPALYQTKIISNVFIVEAVVGIFAIIAVAFTIRSRKIFENIE